MSETDTAFRSFLGDGERVFRLTPPMIVELERLTGAGIGSIVKRLVDGHFTHAELVDTIRLGLIGGGEASPEDARAIVDTYVIGRPLAEVYPIGVGILESLYFGGKA